MWMGVDERNCKVHPIWWWTNKGPLAESHLHKVFYPSSNYHANSCFATTSHDTCFFLEGCTTAYLADVWRINTSLLHINIPILQVGVLYPLSLTTQLIWQDSSGPRNCWIWENSTTSQSCQSWVFLISACGCCCVWSFPSYTCIYVYIYVYIYKVVVSNIFYKKSPLPGENIKFDEHIFHLGLKPPTSILYIYTLYIHIIYIHIVMDKIIFIFPKDFFHSDHFSPKVRSAIPWSWYLKDGRSVLGVVGIGMFFAASK